MAWCVLLSSIVRRGSRRNQVTIVFDGSDEVDAPQIPSSVRVLFEKRESADDKIKRMVETSRNPRSLIVVSDDKAIKFLLPRRRRCLYVRERLP